MCKITQEQVNEAGSEIWVNKKGERIAVKDMSDAHVRKAFETLLRKIRRGSKPEVKSLDQLFVEEEARLQAEAGVDVKRPEDTEGGTPD